jgi:regulator of cell morphogenesis and NO signaling
VDYLKATHDYYLNYELREIEKMVHNLIHDDGDGEDKVHIIVRFFDNYKQEVLTHIEDEEVTVFPYVKNLKNALEGQKLTNQQKKLLCDFSITSFEANHSDIDMKLTDLKNLLVKYFPGKPNNYVCNELIFRLARFEKDLKDHARIEDKILVSKVKLLEKELNTKII